MVHIEEGDAPKSVPLVYYDKNGKRHVVGEAMVTLRQGRLNVSADYDHSPGATEIPGMNLEAFSIDAPEPTVASSLNPDMLKEETMTAFQRYQRKGLSD